MFGLGLPEIIIIFVIALLVFGPKKLPDLGKSIGRAMAEFKKASDDFQDTVRSEMREVERSTNVREELSTINKQIEHAGEELKETLAPEVKPVTEPAAERPTKKEMENDGGRSA